MGGAGLMPAVALRAAPVGAAVPSTAEGFLEWLGGPTILRLAGRDSGRVRGLSVLLHGNEPSSLRALHAWLRSGEVPAVDVVVFVGAVVAARQPPGFAHRMRAGGRDLNRCFRPPWEGEDGAVAAEALQLLRQAGCEALVDLHNNTGHNPAYGVGTVADAARLNLTAMFAERYVVYDLALGALIEATADDFPSLAIECGRAGDPAADAVAAAGLARYLRTDRLELRRVAADHIEVLASPVRVTVAAGLRLAFGDQPAKDADLTLRADIDRHNFQPLLPGAPVGFVAPSAPWPLVACGADGVDVSRDVFEIVDGLLRTRRGVVPIMMTTDPAVAVEDCLFYLVSPREEVGQSGAAGRAHPPSASPRLG
jgi:Succinylglutamate desuccinylase / Aspartoacylase family